MKYKGKVFEVEVDGRWCHLYGGITGDSTITDVGVELSTFDEKVEYDDGGCSYRWDGAPAEVYLDDSDGLVVLTDSTPEGAVDKSGLDIERLLIGVPVGDIGVEAIRLEDDWWTSDSGIGAVYDGREQLRDVGERLEYIPKGVALYWVVVYNKDSFDGRVYLWSPMAELYSSGDSVGEALSNLVSDLHEVVA